MMERPLLASFKGQKYKIVTDTRQQLEYLHNPQKGIISVTKCFLLDKQDEEYWNTTHCDDESLYNQYDYQELMENSTFSLVPRGCGFNSYRLVEAMSYGSIPVIISDGFVLPFQEIIDWTMISIQVPEKNIPSIPMILEAISDERIQSMRKNLHKVYQKHFSSHLRMLMTAVDIQRRKLKGLEGNCRS